VTLTERQTDVVGLLARGLTVRHAAELLGLSEHTVKQHVSDARLRLGARNTAHMGALALHAKLIVP